MLTSMLPATKRFLRLISVAAVVGAGALAAAPAQAQWHHHYWGPSVGVYVGPGYYGYYPDPYYYAPPPIVVQQPPVYVEQPQAAIAAAPPAPAQNSAWYYCAGSRSYYPYVKECAGGWQQVAPSPAPR